MIANHGLQLLKKVFDGKKWFSKMNLKNGTAVARTAWILGPAAAIVAIDFFHGGRELLGDLLQGKTEALIPLALIAAASALVGMTVQSHETGRNIQKMMRRLDGMSDVQKTALFEEAQQRLDRSIAPLSAQLSFFDGRLEEVNRKVSDREPLALKEGPALWSGFIYDLASQNPTFKREAPVVKSPGGKTYRVGIDHERVAGNMLTRFQENMALTYILYIPREVGFGQHPGEVFLSFMQILRYCQRLARQRGETLNARVRILLVDEPRPNGATFLGYKRLGGKLTAFALEYFRTLSNTRASSTGETYVLQHVDEREIDKLREDAEADTRRAVELGIGTVARLIAPLMPCEDNAAAPVVTLDQWNAIMKEMYAIAIGESVDGVDHPDTMSFRKQLASLGRDRTSDSELFRLPDLDVLTRQRLPEAPRRKRQSGRS